MRPPGAQMNTALTQRSYENNDNVYGAVTFRQADSASGVYDYTVHVSGNILCNAIMPVVRCFLVFCVCCGGGGGGGGP